MVKLCGLLGKERELHFECMYTKHKTQKRKIWHDGFLSIYESRRIVLYEEMPPDGNVIDDTKMSVYEWDRKDEDYINLPKFLVEILNTTPISLQSSKKDNTMTTSFAPSQPVEVEDREVSNRNSSVARPSTTSKFKPVANPSSTAAPMRRPYLSKTHIKSAKPLPKPDLLDFDRHPTKEWTYVPYAIARSVQEIAEMIGIPQQS